MGLFDNLIRGKKSVSDLHDLDGIRNSSDTAILVYDGDTESISVYTIDDEGINERISFIEDITELNEDNINGLQALNFEFILEYVDDNWSNV